MLPVGFIIRIYHDARSSECQNHLYFFPTTNKFALTKKTVENRKKRNEDSFTAFLKVALMLKLLIFVKLFVIKIMLHATTIQDNSSRVNSLLQ